jgi:hypothetical protein
MPDAVSILNGLLHAEHSSLVNRLREAGPFVSQATSKERLIVDQMLADETNHERGLANLIMELRGTPNCGPVPTEVGGLHYLTLSFLIPQIIASKEALIRAYETAGSTGIPRVDDFKNRCLEDHRRHLQDLRRIHGGMAAPVH